jgi:hypothetical protein
MHRVQLLIPLILLTAPSPILADIDSSITADAKVSINDGIACECTATGNTMASASASCTYSAYAAGQLGIGPYGIGVDTETIATGDCCTSFGEASVYFTWQQDFTIEGLQSNGFVLPEVTGLCGNYPSGGLGVNLNLWGAVFADLVSPPGCNYVRQSDLTLNPPIPVTFGVPYTLQISGFRDCIEGEPLPCGGELQTYVSNLTITDAGGNPIAIGL